MTESCSAIILAGGESRRMGRPKAWLDFHGRPLLAHMVELLSPRFDEILVVAAPGQELPETSARIVRDEEPGKGPVAGLVAGLHQCGNPLAFVVAVDLPLLELAVAEMLLWQIGEADASVPSWGLEVHPLCAAYRTSSVHRELEGQLRDGRLRLKEVLLRVHTHFVGELQLRAVDPEGRSFLAMNSPEEYEYVVSLAVHPGPARRAQ